MAERRDHSSQVIETSLSDHSMKLTSFGLVDPERAAKDCRAAFPERRRAASRANPSLKIAARLVRQPRKPQGRTSIHPSALVWATR